MVRKVGIPLAGCGGHMADRRRKLVAGLAALIAFSLVVCPLGWGAAGAPARAGGFAQQITFAPHVTGFRYDTPVPFYFATMTAEAIVISPELGSYYNPTYRRVACTILAGDVCYELCYAGECHLYSSEDERVDLFIDAVDRMRQEMEDYEDALRDLPPNILRTVGECLASAGVVGAALTAFGVYAAASPEPVSKTAVTIIGGIGVALVCGSSLWLRVGNGISDIFDSVGEIARLGREAVFEWQELQRDSLRVP
jgi:hypothetical protein